ncbi:hypothetical protein A2U01_0048996 [Trifolium medium]|uniref:Uncharacterized protein n=1 Tax=Trifolium medium TaxID=97028 RepID=A0A392QWA7_9FABA|nr:hypothetical protein [Trifolium medium]
MKLTRSTADVSHPSHHDVFHRSTMDKQGSHRQAPVRSSYHDDGHRRHDMHQRLIKDSTVLSKLPHKKWHLTMPKC